MPSNLDSFIATIARLRGPDGCPWDRLQNHRSLARYLLEEAYEVLDAIHQDDPAKLREELGDLLLQIVLNAQIASDNGQFDIEDVASSINAKMINRHPHVFGDATVGSAEDVVTRWEEIKKEESGSYGGISIVDTVPAALPALLKALKVSEKAVSEGFEWENEGEIWDKLHSELSELKEAMTRPPDVLNRREIELELGDVLFVLVNVARWLKLNPEESLLLSTDKFRQRYRKMEELAGVSLSQFTKPELGRLWEQAKRAIATQT